VNEALKHRPDLNQARIDLRSKDTELFARRNERRWGLDFEGTYGALGFDGGDPTNPADAPPFSYSSSLEDLRDRNQTSWSLGLALTVPIGNRLAIANYIDAEHALNQSRFELQRRQQQARVEVRNAVRSVLTNIKRVLATRASVRLQREKLEAEQKKFENGMSTSFQVLEFQNDLTSARSRENLAIVDYNKSLVELERVKGTLLQSRKMLIPSQEMGQAGTVEPDYSAALRSLWRRDTDRMAAVATPIAGAIPEAINLPTSFVFTGSRIEARGGTPELDIDASDTR
jgi:outer membrane protein TolC